MSGLNTKLDYKTSQNIPITLDRNNTLAGLYVMVRKNWSEKFIFEPSVRFQYYASLNKLSPEPRLGVKYNLGKKYPPESCDRPLLTNHC